MNAEEYLHFLFDRAPPGSCMDLRYIKGEQVRKILVPCTEDRFGLLSQSIRLSAERGFNVFLGVLPRRADNVVEWADT
jgi:hypothetical protein